MASDIVTAVRSQLGGKGGYLYMIYKALERDGRVDPETLLRGAMYEWGLAQGKANPVETVGDWILGGSPQEVFEKEYVKAEEDSGTLRLGHCGLFEAWCKLGATDQECATLCDIAMQIDHGELAAHGFKLIVTKSLAKGDECCELVVSR